MKLSDSLMNEKCICEDCDNPRILKHFERCEKCFSEGYHRTPRELNPDEDKQKNKNKNESKK